MVATSATSQQAIPGSLLQPRRYAAASLSYSSSVDFDCCICSSIIESISSLGTGQKS